MKLCTSKLSSNLELSTMMRLFLIRTFDRCATISHQKLRTVMREATRQVFWTVLVARWSKVPNQNLFGTFDHSATISIYQSFRTVVRPMGLKSLFQILIQLVKFFFFFFFNTTVKTSNSFIFWNMTQKSFEIDCFSQFTIFNKRIIYVTRVRIALLRYL